MNHEKSTTTNRKKTAVRRWRRYPKYHRAPFVWLGQVPTHWRVKRLKYVAEINPEVLDESTAPDFELKYIDIGNVDSLGRISGEQTYRFEDAPSRARRRVREGDVLISTVRTYLRAIAHIHDPPANLIVSTGFAVLRPRAEIDSRFLWRLVQSNQFVDSVVAHSVGVGYPAINPTELSQLPVWFPPISEQRAIATFLDRETARLDALIAKKERLIALLEEKRQAIISRAVTRGLDSSAPLKDTCVPWLGMVPKHWELRRVNSFCRVVRGASPRPAGDPRYFEGDHVPWITVAEVTKDNQKHLMSTETCLTAEGQALSRTLPEGTFVLTNSGATLGVPKILKISGCINDGSVAFFDLYPEVSKDFLYYFFRSQTEALRIRMHQGMGQPNLNTSLVGSILVPMPPLEEQALIAAKLDETVKDSWRLIGSIQEGIARLQEYRTALISAAVTGQIDIRQETPS